MTRQRVGVIVCVVKAVPCVAAGAWLWSQSLQAVDGLVAAAVQLLALVWFAGAILYLVAAFLSSRRSVLWRSTGGLVEVAVTAAIAWWLVNIALYPGPLFLVNGVDYPPRWTVWALAAGSVTASVVLIASGVRSMKPRVGTPLPVR